MTLYELLIIAVGLSMDAFAVAVCTGLPMKRVSLPKALIVGLYFGFFQALMPLTGYLAGAQFADKITAYDHWIAFLLLGLIGAKMLKDSFDKSSPDTSELSLGPKRMIPLALATSIDALAIGVSFAFLNVDSIITVVSFIGVVTLFLSMAGVKIGNVFGVKFKSKAEFAGGLILIIMGLKILIEHLGILYF